MSRALPTEADAAVLKWCGAMGHTHVVVINDAQDGRRCLVETCDPKRAKREHMREYADRHPVLYQQIRRGVWQRVAGKAP